MWMRLEFTDGLAVLHIHEGDHRIEVRGHPRVGTDYIGDRLDRVLSAIPRTVNISELFAENKVGVRSTDAMAVWGALAREETLVTALHNGTWRDGGLQHQEPWYSEQADIHTKSVAYPHLIGVESP